MRDRIQALQSQEKVQNVNKSPNFAVEQGAEGEAIHHAEAPLTASAHREPHMSDSHQINAPHSQIGFYAAADPRRGRVRGRSVCVCVCVWKGGNGGGERGGYRGSEGGSGEQLCETCPRRSELSALCTTSAW